MPRSKELNDDFSVLLDALTREVYLGRVHHWIWRRLNNALVQHPTVGKTARVFFTLTLRAHLDEAFMHMARLLDTRPGTVRLRSLLHVAKSFAGRFEKANAQEVRKSLIPEVGRRIGALEARSRPVLERRNTLIAHLDPKTLPDFKTIGEESRITVGEMEAIYTEAGDIVNEVSGVYRNSETLMEIIGWEDYEHVVRYMDRGLRAQEEEFRREWEKTTKSSK